VKTFDAVVVGAGILGVGSAYYLARRGLGRIAVLERDSVCAGSTALASGGIRLQWSRSIGIELTRRSLETFERFEAEFGQRLPINRRGYLYLARSEALLEEYRRNVAFQRSQGVNVELLDGDTIGRHFPYLYTADLAGAAYGPDDCQADPYLATTIMAERVRQLGVSIETGCEATGIRRSGGRVSGVATRQGDYDAPIVVIAAGPWSGLVGRLAGVEIPVEPRRRDEFITAPLSTERIPASTPFITDFAAGFSFRREGRGMIIGQRPVDTHRSSFDTQPDWDVLPNLVERAVHRCPALADAAIARAFGGLLEATPDHQGIVDAIPAVAGLYVIAGFSGHGFMQGPAAAEALAELICDGRAQSVDLTPLRYDRFAQGRLEAETMVSLAPGA
jgi:sarcosine oxidase subunit beta